VFDSQQEKNHPISTAPKPALGPTKPPILWKLSFFHGGDTDHSPSSREEVKNAWSGQIFSEYFGFPCPSLFHNFSITTITYYLGLVQYAPRDSVSPYYSYYYYYFYY
jgi:hypothetical protein